MGKLKQWWAGVSTQNKIVGFIVILAIVFIVTDLLTGELFVNWVISKL